jgi:3-oxoacyl-[acyl-carrier protein] reductase
MTTDILDLDGRAALITGAGQGVGRRVALRFAEHGAGIVFVNDLFHDRAERVASEVDALGGKGVPIVADVTDPAAIKEMGAIALERSGSVDIVVNNAGVLPEGAPMKKFVDTDWDEWDPWIKLNLYGVMAVTREFLPGMLEKRWGRVVTVISDAGRAGLPRAAAYGAAKAGAAGFMRCLAMEVSKVGVTANCVALGGVKTEHLLEYMPQEAIDKAAQEYPTKRLGEPEEIANAILFLASDAAAWITGQVVPVNGGYSFAL